MRADDLRFPHFMLTIVSAKNLDNAQRNAAALEILGYMDSIIEKNTRHNVRPD